MALLSCVLLLGCVGAASADEWNAVRASIDKAFMPLGCHVVVGTTSDTLSFEYTKGQVNADFQLPSIASASKWVAGVTSLMAVDAASLALDDRASVHLDWWTTDPSDSRFNVTLRTLLGFTSGFTGSGGSCAGLDFMGCAQQKYERAAHTTAPGSFYEYNELHIDLAGAVVQAATGVPIVDLVQRSVLAPLGMDSTRYTSPSNPALGSGLTSTSRDYLKFLRAVFAKELLSPALHAEMESDQYPNAGRDLSFTEGWRYGLTNWYECDVTDEWSETCRLGDVHSSSGVAGLRPIVDRKRGYYLQIGSTAGPLALTLYRKIKPQVDAIFDAAAAAASA